MSLQTVPSLFCSSWCPTLPFVKEKFHCCSLPHSLRPRPCPECSLLFFLRNFIFPLPPALVPWLLEVDLSPSRQQSQHCNQTVPVLPCSLPIIMFIQIIYKDLYPSYLPTHILPSQPLEFPSVNVGDTPTPFLPLFNFSSTLAQFSNIII